MTTKQLIKIAKDGNKDFVRNAQRIGVVAGAVLARKGLQKILSSKMKPENYKRLSRVGYVGGAAVGLGSAGYVAANKGLFDGHSEKNAGESSLLTSFLSKKMREHKTFK